MTSPGPSHSPLEKIPEDILSIIFSHLEIHDLAAFQQASWTTYHQADSDVLWHQLLPTFHLPISVPLGEALNLPAPTIRRLLNRASKLERMLRTSRPRLREVANVQSGDFSNPNYLQAMWTSQRDWILISSHEQGGSNVLALIPLKDGFHKVSDPQLGATVHLPETSREHSPGAIVAPQWVIATTNCEGREVVVLENDRRNDPHGFS
jgi:hypothetical protein